MVRERVTRRGRSGSYIQRIRRSTASGSSDLVGLDQSRACACALPHPDVKYPVVYDEGHFSLAAPGGFGRGGAGLGAEKDGCPHHLVSTMPIEERMFPFTTLESSVSRWIVNAMEAGESSPRLFGRSPMPRAGEMLLLLALAAVISALSRETSAQRPAGRRIAGVVTSASSAPTRGFTRASSSPA